MGMVGMPKLFRHRRLDCVVRLVGAMSMGMVDIGERIMTAQVVGVS
jgi:hypothetical protein